MNEVILRTAKLTVMAGKNYLIDQVDLEIPSSGVFGVIGPSGAGKSTLLKSLNRLIELTPNLKVMGQVYHHGEPIYTRHVDPDVLRTSIGMIFQQPVVFPKSILANVLFGVRYMPKVRRRDWADIAQKALTEACLWDEVKDRLKSSALRLSVGQQQRLCMARALATQPKVILMDEPTSALDPKSTEAVEQLILNLKRTHAIVLVTHNIGQASRVCDQVAYVDRRQGRGQVCCCGNVGDVLSSSELTMEATMSES